VINCINLSKNTL